MAYKELARAYMGTNSDLIDQIAGACLSCVFDIQNENPATANHANRIIWCNQVRTAPAVKALQFLIPVCENATIAASMPNTVDSDIKFVVASNIDTFATGV